MSAASGSMLRSGALIAVLGSEKTVIAETLRRLEGRGFDRGTGREADRHLLDGHRGSGGLLLLLLRVAGEERL
jgi:hypothetical protein